MMQEKRGILKVMQGEMQLETIPLQAALTVIGRERTDVVLDDGEVSSSHCQIQILNGDFHLFDLHSTNGTFVNGQRIVKSRLQPGDRIRVGKTDFVFDFASDEVGKTDSNGQALDPANYLPPEASGAKEIDDIFMRERSLFLKELCIVADVTYGDGTFETLKVKGEIVLGRLVDLGAFSRDDELSRKHARFFIDDDANAWVEDLGSTNGVVVNGIKISRAVKISEQDVVKAGRCKFKIKVQPAN